MGAILSNSWNSDKKTRSQLMDDSVWFTAKIIDYTVKTSNILKPENYDKQNQKPKRKSSCKEIRYTGRISVKEECLVFQSLNPLNSLLVNPNCYDRFVVNNGYNNSTSPINNNVFTFGTSVAPVTSQSSSSSTQQNSPSQISTSSSVTSTGNNNNHKKWSGSQKYNGINDPIAQYHTISWPLCTVRNFAFCDNIFSFDTGRMSPTGESRFTFKINKFSTFYKKFAATQYSVDRLNIFSSPMTKCHQRSRTLTPGGNDLMRITKSKTLTPVISRAGTRKLCHIQKAQSVKNLYELNDGGHQDFVYPPEFRNIKNSDFKTNKVQLRRGSQSIGDFEYRYQNIHNTIMNKSINSPGSSPKYVLTNQNSNDSNQSPIEYINLSFANNMSNNKNIYNNENHNYCNDFNDDLSPLHNSLNTSPNYAQIYVNSPSSLSSLQSPSGIQTSSPTSTTEGNYLVICEKHTRAVEQVMKRIK